MKNKVESISKEKLLEYYDKLYKPKPNSKFYCFFHKKIIRGTRYMIYLGSSVEVCEYCYKTHR